MNTRTLLTFILTLALTQALWAQDMPAPDAAPAGGPPLPGEAVHQGGDWSRGPVGDMGNMPPKDALIGRFITTPRAVQALGLTEEQVTAIRAALGDIRNQTEALRSQLEAAAMEQGKLLMAEALDETALMAAVEKTGQIRTEMAKLHIQPTVAIKKILTPEQVKKARAMMEEQRNRRQDWREQRRNEGGPGRGQGRGQGNGPNGPGEGEDGEQLLPKPPVCPSCGAASPAPTPPAPEAPL